MAKKAPPSILQLLKECETAQSIFQDMMIVSLPQDFPLKYRILLEEICQALGSFRNKENIEGNEAPMFHRILAKADRGSRNCRFCDAYESCKWSVEEKEHRIER